MKIQITLSEDRDATREELAAAGIDPSGVAQLGYDHVPDAPKGAFANYPKPHRAPPLNEEGAENDYRSSVLARLNDKRISGVGRAD